MCFGWAADTWVAIGTLTLALATLCLAVGTFILVWWTVSGEQKRKRKDTPILEIGFESGPPDYIKIPVGKNIDSYFIRFRVINKGEDPAEYVEAYLAEVWERHDGYHEGEYEFKPYKRHIPIHLRWSIKQVEEIENEKDVIFYPRVNKSLDRFWNLCYIVDPKYASRFRKEDPLPLLQEIYPEFPMLKKDIGRLGETPALILDTIWKPSSRSYMLLKGYYMLKVIVAASNAEMKTQHFDIDFRGKWNDNEHEMRKYDLRVLEIGDDTAEERKKMYKAEMS